MGLYRATWGGGGLNFCFHGGGKGIVTHFSRYCNVFRYRYVSDPNC